jgi:hypothetical protein
VRIRMTSPSGTSIFTIERFSLGLT